MYIEFMSLNTQTSKLVFQSSHTKKKIHVIKLQLAC